ncbi:hypothetical protein KDA11_04130 [Candidatus Saccharibacteria bacterium]|nr:hypothetical protein [Candidatus Saccharibacteria bacterium]
MINKIVKIILGNSQQGRRAEMYRSLIRQEAKIGGTLFGPIPKDGRREFFCLDARTWIWHEEWADKNGKRHSRTTRYDVRPNGILKAQDGSGYQYVSLEEAKHLRDAAHLYQKRIHKNIYSRLQPSVR